MCCHSWSVSFIILHNYVRLLFYLYLCELPDNTGCADGDLRLVTDIFDRNTTASGLLEVCQGGVFGTVCSDLWNITNPRVACDQLGYSFQSKNNNCC